MSIDLDYFKEKLKQCYLGQAMNLRCFKTFEDFTVFGQLQAFSNGEFSGDGLTRKDRERLFATNIPLVIELFEAFKTGMQKWNQFEDPKRHVEGILKKMETKERQRHYEIRKEVTLSGKLRPQLLRYLKFKNKISHAVMDET